MATLTIEIPEKVEKTLSDLVEQLGGKVIATDTAKKLSKPTKKKQILHDLEESMNWVKLHQERKMTDEDIKRLSDLAKEKLKAGRTKEQALLSFIDAGIMNEKGEYTKRYAILETLVKKP